MVTSISTQNTSELALLHPIAVSYQTPRPRMGTSTWMYQSFKLYSPVIGS